MNEQFHLLETGNVAFLQQIHRSSYGVENTSFDNFLFLIDSLKNGEIQKKCILPQASGSE